MDREERVDLIDLYNIPRVCQICGGVMVFKGVGEYHCENCGDVAYDDYGKPIRSGQYCPECEVSVHRKMEEKQRQALQKSKNMQQGYSGPQKVDEGQRRFRRDS